MLNGFNYSLFVWATLFLDTTLVTVITGGWLILFVAYQRQHDRSGRYQRVTVQDWLLMGIALLGIALLTLSQSGGITTGEGWRLLSGVLLAAACAVSLSWISFRFKLGTELYDSNYRGMTEHSDDLKDELACVIAVSIVANIPGMVGGLLIGLTFFPAHTTGSDTFLGGFLSSSVIWVIAAGIANGVGTLAFRYANLLTRNLAVNAMQ
ncbi:MAG: hypothetical protein F4176_06980 [Acidimicrobiia bacterium]|nr:hypothetical protein [Acidimicrobiia bacterium]